MEYSNRCTMRKLTEYFKFEQLCGNNQALDRWVVVPDLNRPGLELSGFFEHTEPRRIVVLGDKEMAYIQTMGAEHQRYVFEKLTDGWTPSIIITRSHECPPILMEVAQAKNFPIFRTTLKTYQLMVDVISYLDEQLSESDTIHGVLMSVYGKGVLITGESGMGKSELGLELIRKGHVLIADDRVDVRRIHNTIYGSAPELLKGYLELRGIGIIDIERMFGASSMLDTMRIDFVVYLEKWQDGKAYKRVSMDSQFSMPILGIDIPKMVFPVKEGRNLSVLIEAAVTDFTLKEKGIDAAKSFDDRVYDYIVQQNQEQGRE
ncbi:MAG: HPr(Ser) kinase/phosphatase [Erysipelotrichia bacterium]|jgi:HPr kinase/phosphorylase|nr:HPr(Ser) kinase/phosphatase [Erysipelotrichia bacterium]